MPSDTEPTNDAASRPPSERAHGIEAGELGRIAPEQPIAVVCTTAAPESTPHSTHHTSDETAPSSKWTQSIKCMIGIQSGRARGERPGRPPGFVHKIRRKVVKYTKFIGPGFMVSVAYIDPGTLAPRMLRS